MMGARVGLIFILLHLEHQQENINLLQIKLSCFIHNWHTQKDLSLIHPKTLTFLGVHSKSQAKSMILSTIRLPLLVMQIHRTRHHLIRQLPNFGKQVQV